MHACYAGPPACRGAALISRIQYMYIERTFPKHARKAPIPASPRPLHDHSRSQNASTTSANDYRPDLDLLNSLTTQITTTGAATRTACTPPASCSRSSPPSRPPRPSSLQPPLSPRGRPAAAPRARAPAAAPSQACSSAAPRPRRAPATAARAARASAVSFLFPLIPFLLDSPACSARQRNATMQRRGTGRRKNLTRVSCRSD